MSRDDPTPEAGRVAADAVAALEAAGLHADRSELETLELLYPMLRALAEAMSVAETGVDR